jgi:hypothetical protein
MDKRCLKLSGFSAFAPVASNATTMGCGLLELKELRRILAGLRLLLPS